MKESKKTRSRMIGHKGVKIHIVAPLAIKNNPEFETQGHVPSTCSRKIMLTDLLKDSLQFRDLL